MRARVWLSTEIDRLSVVHDPYFPAALHIGAEGLYLKSAARSWHLSYRSLATVEIVEPPGFVRLVLHNGRAIDIATPGAHALERRLAKRRGEYSRHQALADTKMPADTAPSSVLWRILENPAVEPEIRQRAAELLGRRPLADGDALFFGHVLHDIADPELRHHIERSLELPR